ncbi:hypothetical protein QBC99_002434 [Beijerinckia sp. GAS462]|nr:hypothetical protein [Beijerinckia sp. GAS462]MDH7796371.1 hypothetical protein [Beijerinckia sp. GAS462]
MLFDVRADAQRLISELMSTTTENGQGLVLEAERVSRFGPPIFATVWLFELTLDDHNRVLKVDECLVALLYRRNVINPPSLAVDVQGHGSVFLSVQM